MLDVSFLPFELWHDIFRDIYSTPDPFPVLDDAKYVLSPLHRRLLINRHLSSVSKHFSELSSSVFMEELHLADPESLAGVAKIVTKHPNLARVVRKLSFNFHEYRCGASKPSKPRALKPPPPTVPQSEEITAQGTVGLPQQQPSVSNRFDRPLLYTPSSTQQVQHWLGWIGFVRTILSACLGVSEVSINATSDYSNYHQRPNARRGYMSLFGSPDLNNTGLISGLLAAENLKVLKLVDPSPIDEVGSSLSHWHKLREVSITVSKMYPEARKLSEMAFVPPSMLERLSLINLSEYKASLPLSSDLSLCTSLSSLNLGVIDLSMMENVAAASYLIGAYQHSLTHLGLGIRKGMRDIATVFRNGDLHFPVLKSLSVRGGTCHISLFSVMEFDVLEELELRSMDVDFYQKTPVIVSPFNPTHHIPIFTTTQFPSPLSTDAPDTPKYWNSFFSQSSMCHLKSFRLKLFNPRISSIMRQFAVERGIELAPYEPRRPDPPILPHHPTGPPQHFLHLPHQANLGIIPGQLAFAIQQQQQQQMQAMAQQVAQVVPQGPFLGDDFGLGLDDDFGFDDDDGPMEGDEFGDEEDEDEGGETEV